MIGTKLVVMKPRKVHSEFCTVCNEFLTGNGSLAMPWKCACGVYTFNWGAAGYVHPKEVQK